MHVFDWPEDNLLLPGLKNKVTKAYFLADPTKAPLHVEVLDDAVSFNVPGKPLDKIDTVLVVEIEGAPRWWATSHPLRKRARPWPVNERLE